MKKLISRRNFLKVCALAGSAAALSACGGKQSTGGNTEATATDYKDTLIWAQGADVTSFDPH